MNQNFSDLKNGLDTAMPSGGIIIWSGAIIDIPPAWYLCDGDNDTPDLTDKFVLGAGGDFAVGATGGEREHTLTIAEMPEHDHSASVSTNGAHLHNTGASSGDGSGPYIATSGSNPGSVNTGTAGDHTHTVTIGDTGGGDAHNNMPPYLALAYIMKS